MNLALRFQSSLLVLLASCGGDAMGNGAEPTLARPPQRIVAGSVLAAEVLFEIAPRERIAAVHDVAANIRFSNVADQAKGLPRVGAEPEQLLSVNPDLVIVDAFTKPETLALVGAAGVPVLRTLTPRSFADVAENLRRIGRACHLQAGAERLIADMEARLAALVSTGNGLGGLAVMSLDGGLHTYGAGSLFDSVVGAAGARNLAADNGAGPFRIMSVEAVLAWRPEILVVVLGYGDEAAEREWIMHSPGFQLLPAVAEDRIVFVPSALFGTTSHRIVEFVAFLQQALRPWGPK